MSKWSELKVSHKSPEEASSRKLAVSDEVAVFLQGQAEFRYNTVLCKVEYRIHTEEHWQEMSHRPNTPVSYTHLTLPTTPYV